ncbi:MAG: hypothetical protein QUS35_00230 [bacterium]|nr:hypothetical protein [bacterium]
MKAGALAALSAAAFISLVFTLKIPWPFSVFVLLPLYMLLLAGLVIRHNVTARPSWQRDASAPGRPDPPEFAIASGLAEGAGLRRIGDFTRPTLPENRMRVFLKPDGSLLFCLRRRENDVSFECVTFLDDGGDLTTTTDRRTRHEPRPYRRRLLLLGTDDPLALMDEHQEGVRLLSESGKRVAAADDTGWLAAWTNRESDLVRSIRSSGPLWPFRVLWWNITKSERGYGIPLRSRGLSAGTRRDVEKNTPGSGPPRVKPGAGDPAAGNAAETGDEGLFRVIFDGTVAEGRNPDRVKAALTEAFHLNSRQAGALFSGRPVSVKSGVDRNTAIRYQEAFLNAGGVARLEPMIPADALNRPAGNPVAQPGPTPSSSDGGTQAGLLQEDPGILRFRIESMLAAERLAYDRERKSRKSVGWPGYALAIASFIPYIGPVVSSAAIFYGWTRRRSGGGRIIALGVLGGLVSTAAFIGRFEPKQPVVKPSVVSAAAETRALLNGLVRAAEAFRERSGAYPESLPALAAETDTVLQFLDPASGGESGAVVPFYYSLDPSGETYTLLSAGRDGEPGTEDDILPSLTDEELSRTGWRPLE